MADQQDDVCALLNHADEPGLERAIAKARELVDRLDNVVLNIAVTGAAGAGKSTFVNAFRGLSDTDEGAAPTGETETTMEIRAYPHPTMPNVKIWDLPGIGTKNFKAKTYVKDVKLQNYDFFIIVSEKRFREYDIMLAKEIQKNKKNFYFIRSMIDQDIANAERRGVTENDTLQKIKNDCQENLRELGSPPVFLISSLYLGRFDFSELLSALETDLPDRKSDALVRSLPVYSRQCLEKKYNTFQKAVWALAVVSGGIAAAPVPGLSAACDVAMVATFFTTCYRSFGLDDNSLTKLGMRVDKPILQMVKESKLVQAIAGKTFLSSQFVARLGAAGIIESVCSLVPVAGNIAAAGVSFATTRSVLLEGLKELYRVALQVIEMAELT
ncbi:interferon-inducible GTPase 5-like [Sardina pilchardus]|uniref:interferon-inducible GTPase 5-like n=1 Tax=Sardina pilchardus TaxID=27697 RepID=UPI002E14B2B6